MYAIAKKCVEVLEVHRAAWGGSGVGGPTLEDRYGDSMPELVDGRMNRRVLLSIPSGVVTDLD